MSNPEFDINDAINRENQIAKEEEGLATQLLNEGEGADIPSGTFTSIPRTLKDEGKAEALESIASIQNWMLFSDAATAHIASTQLEKYAMDRNLQVVDAVLGTMKSKQEKLGYLLGTARVMLCRYGNKSDREDRIYDDLDLLKAAHYIAMAWRLDK